LFRPQQSTIQELHVVKSIRSLLTFAVWCGVVFTTSTPVHASNVTYSGTLGTGQAGNTCSDAYDASCFFQLTFTLNSTTTVSLQTWSFGGTNGGFDAAGNHVPAGGFDPLVAFWSGTGPTATLIDGSADLLGNYTTYQGCPPADKVAFSNGNACGDLTMQFTLVAGAYMITLSDAAYQPCALVSFGCATLGDSFNDLTGGVFQTCNYDGTADACITPNQNWLFDLNRSAAQVPEPTTLLLVASGVGLYCRRFRWRSRRKLFRALISKTSVRSNP